MRLPSMDTGYTTYKVHVCPSCDRVEGIESAGEPCGIDGCDGTLIEMELIANSIAQRWRHGLAVDDERVQRINADLADVLFRGAAGPTRAAGSPKLPTDGAGAV
jgi:hypothetical protein